MGISPGAGASFLSLCLAKYFANTQVFRPVVIELDKSSIFDAAGLDRHFAGRDYFFFYEAVKEGKSVKGKQNFHEGINWVVRSPAELNLSLDVEEKLRLINQVQGDLIFCDCSVAHEENYRLLAHMDVVLVIIDPLPSKLLPGYTALCEMKSREMQTENVIYVVNKDNGGVNRREMMNFLRLKKMIRFPLIPLEHIYRAEYLCKIPYGLSEVRNQLKPALKEVADLIQNFTNT